MNRDEAALFLNGREYRDEVTPEFQNELQKNKLIAIYAQSDDIIVFSGYVVDEFYSDYIRYIEDSDAIVLDSHYQDERCNIRATFAPKYKPNLSWDITTTLPHSKFTIYEVDEPYCEGFVIDVNEIRNDFINRTNATIREYLEASGIDDLRNFDIYHFKTLFELRK